MLNIKQNHDRHIIEIKKGKKFYCLASSKPVVKLEKNLINFLTTFAIFHSVRSQIVVQFVPKTFPLFQ